MDLKDRRILIVGIARSGIAAARLLFEHGAVPVLNDSKPLAAFNGALDSLPAGPYEYHLAEDPVSLLDHSDILVISPGVPIQSTVVREAEKRGIPVLGEMEIAYSLLKGEMIAISGTNGKTTTTTLLGEIFKTAGRGTHVCGNIGYPVSSVAMEAEDDDMTVIEVSSFQLESIHTFHPHAAALLNITEDHLNRHGTMQEYIRMKKRLFENQTSSDFAVLNMDDPILVDMAKDLPSNVLFFSRTQSVDNGACIENGNVVWRQNGTSVVITSAEDRKIPGPHNLENILAAVAMACAVGVPADVIAKTIHDFAGVEHRIETVRTLEGVTYINDSKGTNVDSTIKAVQSMKVPTVIILGGYDKHTDFSPMCREMLESGLICHAVLIGATADQIERQLVECGYSAITRASSLQDAVEAGRRLAPHGGNVLLSPACASFDMFKDYEQRGEIFKQIVRDLQPVL